MNKINKQKIMFPVIGYLDLFIYSFILYHIFESYVTYLFAVQ